jgi:hypothetical protein
MDIYSQAQGASAMFKRQGLVLNPVRQAVQGSLVENYPPPLGP